MSEISGSAETTLRRKFQALVLLSKLLGKGITKSDIELPNKVE